MRDFGSASRVSVFTSLIRRAPAALSWRPCPARALVVCAAAARRVRDASARHLARSPVSHALSADIATPLRDALASPEAAHPGQSGFRLLADGATALQMRIALARRRRTLDMQYYIATEDTTGKLLLAAARTRSRAMRMLVDDLNFHDIDRVMAALNTHQNIEIRVFNPFGASQRGMVERTANFFTRIDSFTRRMHNKAMIADNQLAIVGGRNLGDEYFSAGRHCSSAISTCWPPAVTSDISKSFDDYWASASSYPLRVLNQQTFDPKDLDAMRDELRDHWRKNADPYNAKPLNATPLARQIARDELELVWAPAEFKVDAPDKVARPTGTYVARRCSRRADARRAKEFLAFSPYFVPHDAGVKILGDTVARGVRVAIVTVARGDRRGRGAGRLCAVPRAVAAARRRAVRIQVAAGPAARAAVRLALACEPACEGVRDRPANRRDRFAEPRPAFRVPEHRLALVVHSPVLAQRAAIFARVTQPDESYRVTLAKRTDGSPPALEWTGTEGGQAATYHVDPCGAAAQRDDGHLHAAAGRRPVVRAATAPAKPAIPVRGER